MGQAKNEYAVTITWLPDDIKTLRPRWSNKRCRDFLARHAKTIQDRSIEMGWDVIETCLDWDKSEGGKS